jgi:AAA ATPase domain
MKQRWTLAFEQLGQIDRGEVRIAPLMVFTGDNNAGKSYVMSLLWGVIAVGRDLLFQSEPPENESYKLCDQWLQAHWGEDVKLTHSDCQLFANWFSDVLHQRRKKICDAVFGSDRVSLKSLRLLDYQRDKTFSLKWDSGVASNSRFSARTDYVRFPLPQEAPSQASRYRMVRYLTWNLIMGDLSAPLFQINQGLNPVPKGEILYLPAARTGFILMRKVLASVMLGMGGGAELPLNLPTRRFLQRLLMLNHSDHGKFADTAVELENEVMHGKILPDASPIPDYQYRPEGTKSEPLPLWLTSSLVTELAPFLMFLRSKEDFRSLIIEEPEAHLHLGLQSKLARILAELVNQGLPIWITTHGDSFFQQISNLVKAGQLKPAQLQSLGLKRAETLSASDVGAWQFVVHSNDKGQRHTVVKRLPVDENGVASTAFNSSIAELVQQTVAINDALDPQA